MNLITRAESKKLNLARYFTGKPCLNGHISERNTSNSTCLECVREKSRKKYKEDPDYFREKKKRNYEANPDVYKKSAKASRERCKDSISRYKKLKYIENKDLILSKNKAYYEKNKTKINLKARDYRNRNKEEIAKKDREKYLKRKHIIREMSKKYRAKNKTKIATQKRLWLENNKEIAKASRWRRKARIKNAEGNFKSEDIIDLFKNQRGKCASCEKSISNGYDIDHVFPLYLGGTNYKENLQLLCPTCNRSKGAKDPIDWANENGKLL